MKVNKHSVKILSPSGYVGFAGIHKTKPHRRKVHIALEDGYVLDCSTDHPVKANGSYVNAESINVGDSVYTNKGIRKVLEVKLVEFNDSMFDVIEVDGGNEYFTNGILSHNCSFLGSTGSLIPADILAKLQFLNPIRESSSLQVFKEYEKGRQYVVTADCAEGLGQDYSVATVFDVTGGKYEQVAVYANNTISPILFPHVLVQICSQYGDAPVIVEANNDVGGQVSYILYYELEYENVVLFKNDDKRGQREGGKRASPGVKMNKKIKAMGCANLKTLLERDVLKLNDINTISELGTFVAKGNSYEAEDGCHDDRVMTLVMFSWFAKQDWFTDYVGADLGVSLYEQQKEQMMEDLMPIGFSHNKPVVEQVNHQSFNVTYGSSNGLEEWMRS